MTYEQLATQITTAFNGLRRGMATLADALQEAMANLRRVHEATLPYRRYLYGGEEEWVYHDEWMSTMCGAWLHESCPSDTYDLQCSCRCHRRKS